MALVAVRPRRRPAPPLPRHLLLHRPRLRHLRQLLHRRHRLATVAEI